MNNEFGLYAASKQAELNYIEKLKKIEGSRSYLFRIKRYLWHKWHPINCFLCKKLGFEDPLQF